MNIDIYNYGDLSKCSYEGNLITLGYEFAHAIKSLNDKDLSTFISDTITHEFIHSLLIKDFNLTTSKLFDSIEHLIGDYKLKTKMFQLLQIQNGCKSPITWHNSILSTGLQDFYNVYHINNSALIQSYIVCNRRLKDVR